MNYLLYQPALLSEPDVVYKDGSLLTEPTERGETYDKIVRLFEKAGHAQYPWVGKVDGLFVVRGLFSAKDEKGRVLAFLFASDQEDFKEELKTLASTVGYAVSDETYASIDFFRVRTKKITLVILTALSLVALVCFTLILVSKCE